MRGLVEQKLKKLHYFPPRFRVQPPHTLLAAHPLFADLPPAAFRREAPRTPPTPARLACPLRPADAQKQALCRSLQCAPLMI